ncbi:ABC transporter ATP-binding protein [Anoxybacterium hadale]|uniref:ABC transporter ATP-binding protein n=1 Tax=Anoxybacterium hadale TaxID=3408580 RepID=A0ACD1ADQ9_9FIRM|nr:ABC transporter ATP-binding protein [Clostridiales bacterium]
MNVLEVKDLCVSYYEKNAVNNVSFTVPENKIVAIVGESGSGKSTIIKAVIKLLSSGGEITGGDILFNGKDITKLTGEQMRKLRGKEIAMIFQDAGAYLNPRLKIGSQYLETILVHQPISKAEAKELAEKMLLKLKLADPERIMKSYPFQLSGGMKQRVAIAMAMSMEPKLLLADEPTSALDVTVQAQVVHEMMTLRDELGTSIIIVTHNMGVASRMADYIAVMCEGELMEFGTRDQVIETPKSDYTKTLLSVVPELKEVSLE